MFIPWQIYFLVMKFQQNIFNHLLVQRKTQVVQTAFMTSVLLSSGFPVNKNFAPFLSTSFEQVYR